MTSCSIVWSTWHQGSRHMCWVRARCSTHTCRESAETIGAAGSCRVGCVHGEHYTTLREQSHCSNLSFCASNELNKSRGIPKSPWNHGRSPHHAASSPWWGVGPKLRWYWEGGPTWVEKRTRESSIRVGSDDIDVRGPGWA